MRGFYPDPTTQQRGHRLTFEDVFVNYSVAIPPKSYLGSSVGHPFYSVQRVKNYCSNSVSALGLNESIPSSRYVVLNPIRARMIKNMDDRQWSSYHAMKGDATAPEWLETDWLLSQFVRSRKAAREKYKNFVRDGVRLPPIWEELTSQIYLGDDTFVKNCQAIYSNERSDQDLKEIPRLQRGLSQPPLTGMNKHTRP